ncbi:MAG: sulfotransferase family 2 domain-containing protein [Rhodospirillales bacterium]|nr:sulfotransferase family 2 domain-containing protein [Rhodospirillales bacterium]
MSSKGVLKYVSPYATLVPKLDLTGHVFIFTHIPKSAGTSLDYVLTGMASACGLTFRRAMGTLYGIFLGTDKGDAPTDFARLQSDVRERLDIVSGHLPFGVHARLSRPALYMTILREPTARLVSHFRFGVRRGGWPEARPLDDLFRGGYMVDNLQTRQLAGLTDPKLSCTAAVLDRALANLRGQYGVVATTDNFDSALKALIALFRWPDVAYSDRQVGSPEPPDHELLTRAIAAVERYFACDRALYAQVLARPTPWRSDLFEGAADGCHRQDRVLVTSPLFRLNERHVALLPAQTFDETLRPALHQSGIELKFV